MWKVSQHNEKPTIFLHENCDTANAMQVLSLNANAYDPRAGRCYKIFYSKLPIPVAELENCRHTRIQALYEKFYVTVGVFLSKKIIINQNYSFFI